MSKGAYKTTRTTMWRSRNIQPYFMKAIDTIEEFGCQVMSVTGDMIAVDFSYTAGVYDSCGKPELITVGLPSGVAHSALNKAISLMKTGIDLTLGRHNDLIGNVNVEFRQVDPKWLHHVMLRTDWFYEGIDVPVLQLIYPDLENCFQDEDDNFNEFFRQPILTGEIEDGTVAFDFWFSHDEASSFFRWKFSDGPHTSAYLSATVYDQSEGVTYVSHDLDGDWQFLGDKMSEGGGPILSCLHHPIDNDRSLEELHDLPLNWYATRENSTAAWERFEHPPVESNDQPSANPKDSPLLN